MDPEVTKLVVGVATPALAAAGLVGAALVNAWLKREKTDDSFRPEAAAPSAPLVTPPPGGGLEQSRELTEWVQGLINAATRPLHERLDQYQERDKIVSQFMQRLYWWDDSGRRGDMPRLTYEQQRALDLELFPEQTQPGRPTADPD
jgi:hypothetical protein